MGRTSLRLCLIWLLCLVAHGVNAAEPRPVIGQSVVGLIEAYRDQGMPFIYSSDLLPNSLLVQSLPPEDEPLAIVRGVLNPHGLAVLEADDLLLIVRSEEPADQKSGSILVIIRQPVVVENPGDVVITASEALPEPEILAPGIFKYDDLEPGQYDLTVSIDGYVDQTQALEVNTENIAAISVTPVSHGKAFEKIIVTTSRYDLRRQLASSVFYISSESINRIPDLGDDPIRASHRLPGVAAGGLSAKSHFRGGEQDEAAIVLNGHRLLDPFHIRNYQSVFSAIDPRAISDIEVYTGGFPVKYGTRMSGLTVIDTLQPEKPLYTELGLSAYNTSVLSAGSFSKERGNWLASFRRGNLDLVVPRRFGKPSYSDVFLQGGYELTPTFDISVNAFFSTDRVLVVTEADADDQKMLDDASDNNQFWIKLDNQWTDRVQSSTVLSYDKFRNDRVGSIADIEKIVGNVNDRRSFDIYGVVQDWSWLIGDDNLLQWGVDLSHSEAEYRYISNVNYLGFDAAFVGVPDSVSRNISVSPDGDMYSAYISNRKKFGNKMIAEFGFRWDKQTYSDVAMDADFSPRFNFFYPFSDRTELRFSWGRFYQIQGINELQVEDGVQTYFPAQKSDQIVLGLQRRIGDNYRLRAEFFNKDMKDLKPRYENVFDPLALIAELEPDRTRIAPSKARARGAEFLLEYNSQSEWSWWASYTWSRVEDTVNGADVVRSWDQTHSVQSGFAWTSGPWDVDFAARVHSGWPSTGLILTDLPGGGFEVMPAARNAERYNEYATVDFRVNRRFNVGNGVLNGFVELSNALNRQNACCIDYDVISVSGMNVVEAPRRYWLPLLPAVGVLYQF